jgi:hypothetical protein
VDSGEATRKLELYKAVSNGLKEASA